ncbi:MAG: hypothetical protein DMG78_14830 [Acidobacteria bacterium]|nr:MAG: hypothetical protein DMG78_14830 [Acidobacteriota bacterium]
MSTKKNGVPCYDNAAPDEPLFVLRGNDTLAAATVLFWCSLAIDHKVSGAKVQEAMNCAEDMRQWALDHGTKKPD